MSFRRRLKFFLVHTLHLSNMAAQELINRGAVKIDGNVVLTNCLISPEMEIKINNVLVRAKTEFVYLKFYKPAGFQSTLSQNVPDSLAPFFTAYQNLSIAGRLDKRSEGLLLLSNDGKWVEDLCNPKYEKEKEYEVKLAHKPGEDFIKAFKKGVDIGNYTTKPCSCELIEQDSIRVILTEGKNRQIRRMCRALGYQVVTLKRLRVANVRLHQMLAGQTELIQPAEGEVPGFRVNS